MRRAGGGGVKNARLTSLSNRAYFYPRRRSCRTFGETQGIFRKRECAHLTSPLSLLKSYPFAPCRVVAATHVKRMPGRLE